MSSCAMRKTDAGKYKNALKASGHVIVPTPEESDVIFVWTCAFRSDFKTHSINALKHYQDNYGKRVIACGCLPSIDLEAMREEYGGEYFEWKHERLAMKELFGVDLNEGYRPLAEKALDVPIEEFKKENPKVKTTHCDQFVKLFISEGCVYKCTYCAERLAFPPYRSFPLESLVEKCGRVVEEFGEKRVVLHGDLVGEYGRDIGSSFPELMEMLVKRVPDIELGIRNFHPIHYLEYMDFFNEYLANGKIFLLETPIQSASDPILKAMGRIYTKQDLVRIFNSIRETGFTEVETHIIAGFPGETRERFQETVD
ncbi:MAG: radical SAM protein, partial [Thermodesulfobacteriota bacterium]|nr:radical SAM protein [Thermodesulfobacteriota bacterium]